jgi:ABC-type Fe3+-hydroxamate transport system substrate-binding protein
VSRRRPALGIVWGIVTAFVLLCGCTAQKPPIQKHSDHGAFPVVVQQITLNSSPQRIVCLFPEGIKPLENLGMTERLVGIGEGCTLEASEPPATVGTPQSPDVEAIIGCTPDLVITNTPMSKRDMDTLEGASIQVLVVPDDWSEEQYQETFERLDGDPSAAESAVSGRQ